MKKETNASFFSLMRFGPGTIAIFAMLLVLALGLYFAHIGYLAILVGAVLVLIFIVKSIEVINPGLPEERKLAGSSCLVVKDVTKETRGIVKLYRDNGELDPELWSAELVEGEEIQEGSNARAVAARGIILRVEASQPTRMSK